MTSRLIVAFALLLAVTAVVSTQQPGSPPAPVPATPDPSAQPEQPLPRFRGAANLVRVDAYVMKDGVPVTDLTVSDFEVVEDSMHQRVETFELIQPRGPAPEAVRAEPNTVAESRAMAAEADARVFVLFMDIWHVHLGGSYRAQGPMTRLLDQMIGQDDMVGIMTPEMSARNIALARRTRTLEGILKDNWFWGQRDRINSPDPVEQALEMCYPEARYGDLVQQIISRRRERKTLDAIQDLIVHLEGVREERKFVVMLSEGWLLPRRDDSLGRVLDDVVPGREPAIRAGVDGRLTRGDPRNIANYDQCERERLRLAAEDLEMDFQFLLQRANRANVSFYVMDPRGLVAFDQDIGPNRPPTAVTDAARLNTRQTALRELAENTDGFAVLNTNNMDAALKRMVADTGAYYLLGYYSTNTRLDGRYRKLSVRVKRPGVEVRARPGYLAPTEAEAASARVDALMNGAAPGHSTMKPSIGRALDGLALARGIVPLRVQATAGVGQIWLTAELDPATQKLAEWTRGGRARVLFEHDRGAAAPIEVDIKLEPGQRMFTMTQPATGALPPGRYVIRLQLVPEGSTLPLQTTADVSVPETGALLPSSGIAARRGPSTGLHYVATADARFRRTERLRVEVPRISAEGVVNARLLGRDGQPLPLTVTVTERVDQNQQRLIVADLTLAPLAQGEYVLEVSVDSGAKTESATYGFRIIP
jgi:VWFA-related protein